MSPDALILACTHRSLRAFPFDLTTTSHLSPSHPLPTALQWFPTGNLLVVASPTPSITFLAPPALSPVGEIASALPSSARILSLSISEGSRFLALGRSDGVVSVLDLVTKAPMTSFTLAAPVVSVSFQRSPDARYLACATATAVSLFSRVSNRLVARFAVASSARTASFSGAARHSRPPSASAAAAKITNVNFSPAHLNLLVAIDESGCVNVWDVAKNVAPRARTEPKLNGVPDHESTYARFTSPFRAPATALSFAPAGAKVSLCVGGFDKQLRFFDPTLRKLLFSVSCAAPVSAVSFGTDGRHLAVGLTNGKVQMFQIDSAGATGKMLSETFVDDDVNDEPTAVRSVHFQPTDDSDDTRVTKGLHNVLKSVERPFPLAGIAQRASPMKKRGGTADDNERSDDSDLLLSALIDDDDQFVDTLGDGLDIVPDAISSTPARTLRSALGPRDSDIFSPVVRTPRHADVGANGTSKASSFHETPGTVERKRKITFRTPRSRSAQAFTPVAERAGESVARKERIERTALESDSEHPIDPETGEVEQVDSDSLDSLPGKPPARPGSSYPTRADVSQLQGSTFSDDVGNAFSDEREENTSRGSDRSGLPSPQLGLGQEGLPAQSPDERRVSMGAQKSVSQGFNIESSTDRRVLPRYSSLPEKMTRPVATVTFESPGMSRDANKAVEASGTGADPRHGKLQEQQNAYLSQPSSSAAGHATEAMSTSENPRWLGSLREQLRQVIAQELDVVKTELRSDILDIHSEMVVMSARQSQELKAAFVERDRRVKQLEAEVRRLQGDNERLRRKYGLP